MIDPTLLLQSGPFMTTEKKACCFSNYPIKYCKFEDLTKLDVGTHRTRYVPVGTVEFVEEFARVMNLTLPTPLSSFDEELQPYLLRNVREGTIKEALAHEFVKPRNKVKLFTGCSRSSLPGGIDEDEPVWIIENVPFESEFRFYMHELAIRGAEVYGWARYDDLGVINPEPDVGLVEDIARTLSEIGAPNAYSIDIGWRPDIERYCLIEINDAWALGLYNNTDKQSNPPTMQQYADMLYSRWVQIVFCNVIDETP